ncbi:MAG: CAP domain-containing protein [Oscillospiraceae bacterium]|jgi:uncharacterized protein YkwD|nr:CAP domain-containing protein [Oscillospiraceae bacterium]
MKKIPRRTLSLVCVSLLVLAFFALPVTAVASDYAARVVNISNRERAARGVGALAANNSALTQAAQKRAEECAVLFSHTRPNGSSYITVLDAYNLDYSARGENIAYGYATPEAVMAGWMNSNGHRKNILKAAYTQIGVGVYEAANGTVYAVQLFIDGEADETGGASGSVSVWQMISAWFQIAWDWFARLLLGRLW